jgi:hypothetical protein
MEILESKEEGHVVFRDFVSAKGFFDLEWSPSFSIRLNSIGAFGMRIVAIRAGRWHLLSQEDGITDQMWASSPVLMAGEKVIITIGKIDRQSGTGLKRPFVAIYYERESLTTN